MAVTAQTLLDEAQIVLNDQYVRWSADDMLTFLSDGEKEITIIQPPAFSEATLLPLSAGTRQDLPVRSVELVKVAEAVDGSGAGYPSPKMVSTERLNDILPGWRQSAAAAVPLYLLHDPEDPRRFEVCPPSDATGSLWITCYATPPAFAAADDAVHLPAAYHPALVDYLLYRCYQMDTETGSAQRAAQYLADFSAKVQAVIPRGKQ